MKSLRKNDDNCYFLAKTQSLIFEESAIEKIPSSYFIKVFSNSKYCKSLDNLSYLDDIVDYYTILQSVKDNVHMKRGNVYPSHVMAWVGYLLREWSYIYKMRTTTILKAVSLSFLVKVYPLYHSLDVNKAILMIAEANGLDITLSLEERTIDAIKNIKD